MCRLTVPSERTVMIPSRGYNDPDPQNRPKKIEKQGDEPRLISEGRRQHTCHEDIARLWNFAAFSQQFEQVPELTMYISTNRYRT